MIKIRVELESSTDITVGMSKNMSTLELTIKSYSISDLKELVDVIQLTIEDEENR